MRAFDLGNAPDDFLYGMNHVKESGISCDMIEPQFGKNPIVRDIWKYSIGLLFDWLEIKFSFTQFLQILKPASKAEVVISTVDTLGLPLLVCKKLKLISGKVIFISQGLTNPFENSDIADWKKKYHCRLYKALLKDADVIVVLGDGAREAMIEYLSLPKEKIKVIQYGIDQNFWTTPVYIQNRESNYVLSVGSDPIRDYTTLLEALKGVPLKIVSKSLPKQQTDNLHIDFDYNDAELRALYQNASMVVIPLKDYSQPSGQSATLQAMACGVPVIITKTKGFWDPEVIEEFKHCIFVKPGDVRGLRKVVNELFENVELGKELANNARELVEKKYTSYLFAQRLLELV